jgi:Tol biopolymer transport system component
MSSSKDVLCSAVHPLGVLVAVLSFISLMGAQSGRIAFVSDRTGTWQIYTMNPDGSDQDQITNLAPTDDDGLFPHISPNGQKIIFAYNNGEGPDLYVINVDGTGLTQLTKDHGSFFPCWSPDGRHIAFTMNSKVGTGVIAIMTANGSGKRRILTTDRWGSVAPIYTPKGKQMVFQSEMGGFVSAAWIMNADGSHQHRLTQPALKAAASSISPDGKRVLILDNLNSPPAIRNEIFEMNLDGSRLKRLAPLPSFHHDLWPSYSPDGSKIAFVSDRSSSDITEFTYGTFDIFTMNSDGSELTDVAPSVGSCPKDGNCVDALWGGNPQHSP